MQPWGLPAGRPSILSPGGPVEEVTRHADRVSPGGERRPQLPVQPAQRCVEDALVEYVPLSARGFIASVEEPTTAPASRVEEVSGSDWSPFLIPGVLPRGPDPRELSASRRASVDSLGAQLTILDSSPVPASHDMAITGEPSWRVTAICGSGQVLVGEEFHPELGDVVACVGNVMLLKHGQQVLLCRYPAYAQMVRVQYFCNRLKSQGDCQQFSSDWQVPLRQEEAFMDSVFGCKDMEGSRKEKAMQAANVLAREMGLLGVLLRLPVGRGGQELGPAWSDLLFLWAAIDQSAPLARRLSTKLCGFFDDCCQHVEPWLRQPRRN
eukprot:g25517.t1